MTLFFPFQILPHICRGHCTLRKMYQHQSLILRIISEHFHYHSLKPRRIVLPWTGRAPDFGICVGSWVGIGRTQSTPYSPEVRPSILQASLALMNPVRALAFLMIENAQQRSKERTGSQYLGLKLTMADLRKGIERVVRLGLAVAKLALRSCMSKLFGGWLICARLQAT